jgi:hypothetical protein
MALLFSSCDSGRGCLRLGQIGDCMLLEVPGKKDIPNQSPVSAVRTMLTQRYEPTFLGWDRQLLARSAGLCTAATDANISLVTSKMVYE